RRRRSRRPGRLELLRKLVPKAATVGVLVNPSNPGTRAEHRDLEDAAHVIGQQLIILNVLAAGLHPMGQPGRRHGYEKRQPGRRRLRGPGGSAASHRTHFGNKRRTILECLSKFYSTTYAVARLQVAGLGEFYNWRTGRDHATASVAGEDGEAPVPYSAATGRTSWNTAPLGVFPATHNRPP